MAIDKIDQNREDAQRIDRKEDEIRRQNKARRTTQSFQVQYAAASQAKKQELDKNRDKDSHKDASKNDAEAGHKEEGLLFQIVQSVKSDQDKHSQDSMGQNKKDLNKKDEDKKDESIRDKKEEGTLKDSSRSSEGHKKVGESEGQARDNGSGSGQGGQGGGHSGGEGQGSRSGSGSMGGSGSQGGGSFSGQHGAYFQGEKNKVAAIDKLDSSLHDQGQESAEKKLDELVESIFVGLSHDGNEQVVIMLNDPDLAGIKLTIERKPEGLHITMLCEKKSVRNKLALDRLKLYDRLQKKNLKIGRIDIE